MVSRQSCIMEVGTLLLNLTLRKQDIQIKWEV